MNCTVWVTDPIEWCDLWFTFYYLRVIISSKGGTWNFSWVPGNLKAKGSGASHEVNRDSRRTQTEFKFGRRAVRTIDFGSLWLVPLPLPRSVEARLPEPALTGLLRGPRNAGVRVGKPGTGPLTTGN